MADKIKRRRTPRENELQTAIVSCLQLWCYKKDIRCTSMNLYANQQGDGLGKLCADFITTLNDSEILLAEVKVHKAGKLLSYNNDQYEYDLELEKHGLPILYVYNLPADLPYYQKPQPKDFAEQTLKAVNYSKPSLLPNIFPHTKTHENLLDYLNSFQSTEGDNITRFAELFGILRSEALLSNGLLMLVYGTKKVDLFDDIDGETLSKVINSLAHGAAGNYLNPQDQALLEHFLAEEAKVFARWDLAKKAQLSPPSPTPRNGGSGSSPSP
ncbi:hypothetical protein [Pseudomonas moorei]|uniref:hypothetical protein n=1 Tax=Pseudomonas moorei TaxID=395599 RepID=UPI0020101692|nr:hypothetical protein [Pseudomonas moorei]